MAYSPRYITRDEIPVQIPDDYTDREKGAALEFAESAIELDLNDGQPIPDAQFTVMMEAAIKQKATCELARGAEDPTSTKLGDLGDDGSTKQDYAQSFCDRYDEMIAKIQESSTLPDESDSSTQPYVYTTDKN